MYRETLRNDVVNGNISHLAEGVSGSSKVASKVNLICDGFLEALQTRAATNLQNIITAHVCKSPPDLDAGLSVVARLRGEDVKAPSDLTNRLQSRRGWVRSGGEVGGAYLLPS